ncbi:DUF6270 domain-containing protein [Paeniglutamicibacter gangotriensis]|uniref:DUF6270 domain-containing protein n=1 Tax=Paeniglutamicibacter gangotriensis TaxID=254787 RepID=UPI001CB6D957|nr:DUF6270 domain-containing protein [Paeniglutamicibacter gangotriensis]
MSEVPFASSHSRLCISPGLDRIGLREKTLVINTPWANEAVDGEQTPAYRDFTIEEMNRHLMSCANFIGELGFNVANMPPALSVSSSRHQWGIAPYHYDEPAYLWIRDQAEAALNT